MRLLFGERSLRRFAPGEFLGGPAAGGSPGLSCRLADLEKYCGVALFNQSALQEEGDIQNDWFSGLPSLSELRQDSGADHGVSYCFQVFTGDRILEDEVGESGAVQACLN